MRVSHDAIQQDDHDPKRSNLMRFDEMLGLLPRLMYLEGDSPGIRLFELEVLFWAVVILLTLVLVRYRPSLLEKAEVRLLAVSQYKRFWLASFVLGVIVVRLVLLPWIPVPIPVAHDEFSYLLASDTFAHERLTNPPSPMWVHFESFNINVLPTYQSMYPPAQGLALAIGQKLTTVPWVGVLLSTALMCGAIYWMLLGWLSAPWAWLGGIFAFVRFGIFSYWMNSYCGGSVAALGGALVLGALPRFRNGPRLQTSLVFALGLLLLANSRPLEGFLFSFPLLLAVVVILIKEITSGRVLWGATAKAVLPAMALLAVGAASMLYYNYRGTGNPLLMPYQVNFQAYHVSKPFFFMTRNPIPAYRHPSMKTFYVFHELPDYLRYRYDLGDFIGKRAAVYYGFFIWPLALLVGPCVYAMWRSEMRIVLISLGIIGVELFAQLWTPEAHYAAPATGAFILAVLFSMRHFRRSQSKYTIWGARALAIVIAVWMISPISEAVRDPDMISPNYSFSELAGSNPQGFPLQVQRARIQSELEARSGKQLIIVHYRRTDMPSQDWVFNAADIDDAHVVWARDMGYFKNKELLDFFPDRQAWYVDRGDSMALVLPYDQVMAGFKMAFDGAQIEPDSPRFAGDIPHVPSTTIKPVAARGAVISAPRFQ
jgi:hypothetical protein